MHTHTHTHTHTQPGLHSPDLDLTQLPGAAAYTHFWSSNAVAGFAICGFYGFRGSFPAHALPCLLFPAWFLVSACKGQFSGDADELFSVSVMLMAALPNNPSAPGFSFTLEYAAALRTRMLEASYAGVESCKQGLPAQELHSLLLCALAVLKAEPTVLEVTITDPEAEVVVVGDTHGARVG